jgi:hypothetical protein
MKSDSDVFFDTAIMICHDRQTLGGVADDEMWPIAVS